MNFLYTGKIVIFPYFKKQRTELTQEIALNRGFYCAIKTTTMTKNAIYQIYHVFQQPHCQGLSSPIPASEVEI